MGQDRRGAEMHIVVQVRRYPDADLARHPPSLVVVDAHCPDANNEIIVGLANYSNGAELLVQFCSVDEGGTIAWCGIV